MEREEFRTVEEWAALYDAEPSLRDVFVEGPTDLRLVAEALSELGLNDVGVWDADAVNAHFDEFQDRGWPDNNRSRLLFLADCLPKLCEADLVKRVVAVIDADFDYVLDDLGGGPLLVRTDGTSVELYAWNESVMRRFVTIVLSQPRTDVRQVLQTIEKPLVELFVVRVVTSLLGLNTAQLPMEKAMVIKKGSVDFDRDDYVDRLLTKANAFAKRDEFKARVIEIAAATPGDARQSIHGHDFVELLRRYLSKLFGISPSYDSDLFAGALRSAILPSTLAAAPLFKEIRLRLAPT